MSKSKYYDPREDWEGNGMWTEAAKFRLCQLWHHYYNLPLIAGILQTDVTTVFRQAMEMKLPRRDKSDYSKITRNPALEIWPPPATEEPRPSFEAKPARVLAAVKSKPEPKPEPKRKVKTPDARAQTLVSRDPEVRGDPEMGPSRVSELPAETDFPPPEVDRQQTVVASAPNPRRNTPTHAGGNIPPLGKIDVVKLTKETRVWGDKQEQDQIQAWLSQNQPTICPPTGSEDIPESLPKSRRDAQAINMSNTQDKLRWNRVRQRLLARTG